MLFVFRRAPVGLFETNKEPNSDFSVEGKHEFRALMFMPRCVDELFPEWLDVRLPCATTERDGVKCQSSTSLPRNKLFLSVSR